MTHRALPTSLPGRAQPFALFCFALAGASLPGRNVHAQEPPLSAAAASAPCRPCEDAEDADAEGHGAFLLGVGAFDFSEINDHLVVNGYESFDSLVTLLGGTGHAVLDSGFVIGGRGAAILTPSGDGPGEFQTQLGGGFGMFDLGFALMHTRSIVLTLMGGLGGYGLSLGIDEEAPRASTTCCASLLAAPR